MPINPAVAIGQSRESVCRSIKGNRQNFNLRVTCLKRSVLITGRVSECFYTEQCVESELQWNSFFCSVCYLVQFGFTLHRIKQTEKHKDIVWGVCRDKDPHKTWSEIQQQKSKQNLIKFVQKSQKSLGTPIIWIIRLKHACLIQRLFSLFLCFVTPNLKNTQHFYSSVLWLSLVSYKTTYRTMSRTTYRTTHKTPYRTMYRTSST